MAVHAHALPRLALGGPPPERWPMRDTPANTRKPLPRHIVKRILDASSARRRVDSALLEMAARARATKPARDKARAERAAKKAEGE